MSTPTKPEVKAPEPKPNDNTTDIRKLTREERRARLISIKERGYIAQRLDVELPNDKHGEWVLNDPVERARMEALGFEIDTEHAPKKSLHTDGTGSAIVGDVIFMTCPKEIKEDLDYVDRLRQENLAKRSKGFQEETGFISQAKSAGLDPENTSNRTLVQQDSIKAAVSST